MPLTRRRFIGSAALGAGATAGAAEGARPNILWIIAEDFSPDLGCYGNRLVRTPNLDGLAAEGVRFTNAFTTAPVCSASRSAIATGMYQTSIGAHQHRSHRHDGYGLPDGVPLFTHLFRRAGYHTSNVTTPAPGVRGAGKTDFNFQVDQPFDGTDWSGRGAGQPFYAQINFPETHRAFARCPAYPVSPASVVLPPYYPDHPAIREDFALYLDSAQNLDIKVGKVLQRLKREGLYESTIVFFFGDHGRPMPRGKQFLYDEGIRVPVIVRIPERFRPDGWRPGGVQPGMISAIDLTATSPRLAGIDLPARMEAQAFIGPGARFRDHIVAARDRCDETVDRIRCVRNARYKYIRNFHPERAWTQPNNYKDVSYPTLRVMRDLSGKGLLTPEQARFMAARRPQEELYDLERDPHELHNLAESPAHQGDLAGLRARLEKWIRDTGDRGAMVEDPRWVEDYRYTTQVDGWCSVPSTRLSRAEGGLRVECAGKTNGMLRSCVAKGGKLRLEWRSRSRGARPRSVFWGTLDRMVNRPAPDRQVALPADTGDQWKEHSIVFQVKGSLGVIGFDMGPGEGALDFEWIRLKREGAELIAEWRFRS